MRQNSEIAFSLARGIRATSERTAEPTFVSAERGFRLPSLAIDAARATAPRFLAEALHHLASVASLGPFPALAPPVQRDDRGAHAEFFASVPVVVLGVERGIGQHAIPGNHQGGLGHDRAKLRRVVGRAGGDGRPGEEVAVGVAGDGEFGPKPGGVLPPGPLEEVARGMAAFQARAIDRGSGRGVNQAACACGRSGPMEEENNLPFFSSRAAA